MQPIDPQQEPSRRSFLCSTGALITTAWLGTHWAAITATAQHAEHMGAAEMAAAPAWRGFQFLEPAQARDVDAIAAQIVPSGATPGAREAHAVHFIDHALATFLAASATEFSNGLIGFRAGFKAAHPGAASFAEAAASLQVEFLRTVDQTPFFDAVRMLTVIGMLSSPKYGGNFGGAGWRMMGFEDRHVFTPPFGYYDAHYAGFVPYAKTPA